MPAPHAVPPGGLPPHAAPPAAVAGRLARVGARLVDLVLAFGVAGAYVAVGAAVAGYGGFLSVTGWLIPVAYEIGWSLTGGTPGKRLFRLRVVRAAGGRAGAGMLAGRAVALFPLFPVWLVNLLVMLLDRRTGRAVHDLIAGTVVVPAGPGRYEPAPPAPAAVMGLAPAGRRLAARCVDAGAALALVLLVETPAAGAPAWAQVPRLVAYPLVPLAYELACALVARGTTPGKRLLGLRVVRFGGEPAPVPCLLARAVLGWALALVPALAGVVVDVMAMVRDEGYRRALHDHRHTLVVSVR